MNDRRLLFYTDVSDTGSIAQNNHSLLSELVKRHNRITTVASPQENPLIAEQKAMGIEQHWLSFDGSKNLSRALQNDAEARGLLSKLSPELIVFGDSGPLSSLAAKRAAAQMGIPFVTIVGSVFPSLAASHAGALPILGAIYAAACSVIVASQNDLDVLHRHFHLPEMKGQVIGPGQHADRILAILQNAITTQHDYVTPGFGVVRPDRAFPNIVMGDASNHAYFYMRREIPHIFYCDRRQPSIGFVSRDEASILYNSARLFAGKSALELGCWLGWSACHLAMGGVMLDVIDPLLDQADIAASVRQSLTAAGVMDRVNLLPGYSPAKVTEIAAAHNRRWHLMFIDADHSHPAPLNDSIACESFAQEDAMVLFHDLAAPDVGHGLDYFRSKGWNTMVYQTMQVMGVAWRGNVTPVQHIPDPAVAWELPEHLLTFRVSGSERP